MNAINTLKFKGFNRIRRTTIVCLIEKYLVMTEFYWTMKEVLYNGTQIV